MEGAYTVVVFFPVQHCGLSVWGKKKNALRPCLSWTTACQQLCCLYL